MKASDHAYSFFLRAITVRMGQLGLDHASLAACMHVSRPYVAKVLAGDVNISFDTALRFAEALKMDFFPTLTAKPGRRLRSEVEAAPRYSYSVVSADRLTDSDCVEFSRDYSSSYGVWNGAAQLPINDGTRIRMPAQRCRTWYGRPDFRVVRCYAGERLVGQVIYLDVNTTRGLVAFVVQLAVDEAHRHRGIAKSILHAAFGSSDYYAWAIVSSCPGTVAALEAATFRQGNCTRIARDVEFLRREVFPRIDFLSDARLEVADSLCRVNSGFFTDHSHHPQPDWTHVADRYGSLPEGYEWLAVTFCDQTQDVFGSSEQLRDSSGRSVRRERRLRSKVEGERREKVYG